jgi:hypothetical protein
MVDAAKQVGHYLRAIDRRTGHAAHHAHVPHRWSGDGFGEQSKQDAKSNGFVKFLGITTVKSAKGELVAMNRNGIIAILDDKGREKERYPVSTAPRFCSRRAPR